ncbi:MAG: type I methionyl aminopeptidase [Bacteroidia bacterium]|nr:type I methionyl aminopeptidase [Bacteroidia bacterium]
MKYILKTEEQIDGIRQSCLLVSKTLAEVGKYIQPGVKTSRLDKIAEEYILDHGGKPAFKGYESGGDTPYPATLCVSRNERVVHGVPSDQDIIEEGDIVSVDCGVILNGYYGDSAYTFPVGEVKKEYLALLTTTLEALYKGIECAVEGKRLGDLSYAIQHHCESRGYSVVKEMVGHGVGIELHEPPQVANYGKRGNGIKLVEGIVIAIEPMINYGKPDIYRGKDGWTIFTKDHLPSAHYEHTVVIRKNKAEILTTFDYIESNGKAIVNQA